MASEFERAAAATVAEDGPSSAEVEDLVFKKQAFDMAFHPSRPLLAACTVTGRVHLYRHATADGEAHEKLYEASHHRKAARCVEFSADGRALFSGGSDGRLRVLDVEALQLAPVGAGAPAAAAAPAPAESKESEPINVMTRYGEGGLLATGDDEGGVALWDVRAPPATRQVASFQDHGDFVADLWAEAGRNQLLCAGGDGALSVYDVRAGDGRAALGAISDAMDDELLSLAVLKEGRKVVCGSQEGVLQIFTYGQFEDIDDRFPGHPHSIDAMVKVDEDTIATGSSDGLIRLVSVHPNKLIGVIGEHEEFPIEVLRMNSDNTWMASCSHDKRIKFWDVRYLYEEDSDGDEDGDEEEAEEDDGGGGGGDGGADLEMEAAAARAPRAQPSKKDGFFDGL